MARWLPLHCNVNPAQPFRNLTRHLQQARSELLEWQRYFVWPVEGGEPAAGRDYPAFGFEWEEEASVRLPPPGSGSRLPAGLRGPLQGCSLAGAHAGSALSLELQYDPSLLSEADIRHVAAQLEALLEHAARAPDAPLEALDALGAREHERLLVGFNATDQHIPPRCVHMWISEVASRHPTRTAVVFEAQSLTYASWRPGPTSLPTPCDGAA